MALERQTIEKKDFPIGRRGYEPEAVDAHLRTLADEIDELKRSTRRRSETLASTASEQVRAIVEAAETSAAAIQREAEEEAAEIRAEATSEAQAAREQANDQAREYVGRVSEATAVMLQRIDAMESELSALVESLRTGGNRLNADLQLLETNLVEVREATAPHGRFEAEPEPAPPAAAPAPPASSASVAEPAAAVQTPPPTEAPSIPTGSAPAAGTDTVEPLTEPQSLTQPEPLEAEPLPEPAPAAPAEPVFPPQAAGPPTDGADDTEGARLIALNMALNGTPREETDRYLAENFELRDRSSLLDEVYASIEG